MSCRFYMQFLLITETLYNPVITDFAAKIYLDEALGKEIVKAIDTYDLIVLKEIELCLYYFFLCLLYSSYFA